MGLGKSFHCFSFRQFSMFLKQMYIAYHMDEFAELSDEDEDDGEDEDESTEENKEDEEDEGGDEEMTD